MRYVFAGCVLDTRLYTLHQEEYDRPTPAQGVSCCKYLLEHRDHMCSPRTSCAHRCVQPVHRRYCDAQAALQLANPEYAEQQAGATAHPEPPGLWLSLCRGQYRGALRAPLFWRLRLRYGGLPFSGSRAWVACPTERRTARGAGRGCGCQAGCSCPCLLWVPPCKDTVQDVPEGELQLVTFLSCTHSSDRDGDKAITAS